MANRRVLVKRRKASHNIRKITRTMQLIATARFQSAYTAAAAGRPYTDKLAELVSNLARAAAGIDHPLMHQPETERRAAVISLTSNRGLCAGYNSNVLRATLEHVNELSARDVEPEVHMMGKKGISYFNFLGREMARADAELGDTVSFDRVEPLANEFIERFISGEIDAVYVAYTKFISVGKQTAVVEKLLPMEREAATGNGTGAEQSAQYEFSPDPQSLLNEILPATVRVRLFQSFTDAAVSEQIARMVAMKAATDAAEKMIKRLTQQYNRARQTQITMELLDIVGGANALA